MMKHIVCILPFIRTQARYFIFLLLSHCMLAQEATIAKEMQLFISESDSLDRIEEMIQDTFYQENDIALGLEYCRLYLERGKKEENDAIQLFANSQIAYITFQQADYHEALKRSYIAARFAERAKDTVSSIQNNVLLGSTWYVMGIYDEALKPYLIAKELAAETQNSSNEVLCLVNIANIRAKLKRYGNALDSFNSALKILNEKEAPFSPQDKASLLSSLLGKVLCLAELKRFDEAEETYKKGIAIIDEDYKKSVAIAEKNNLEIFKARFNINLGKVYYEKGEYFKSLGFLQEGKEKLKKAGLQNNLYITDFYIAQNLSKQGKNEEAMLLLDAIFKRAGEDSYTDRIEEMYTLAGDISKIQNNKEKEAFYLRELKDILQKKSEKQSAAKDLLYEDDIKKYELENKKLANENTQSLADKKVIMIVSIVLVGLLMIGFLVYHKRAKLKEQKFLAIIDAISKKATEPKPLKTTQNSAIKDEKAKAILEKLSALEETHFYLSENATLHNTAKLLQTNTTYLSKALNAVKKQSFSQYLNKLRIEYVLVKLKEDAVFRSYTIHAISKEIGYKSATTFIKEFKNKTGLNPSYYIKKIKG
ncbi:DNA-binding transcriptional regulator ChbR [Kordia sp. SMS9]|uniref:helix-turn-helix domain-containing protein n=1 Tax=Kordia sp. SMS9 TaxID=2282170 RepID=UPI000E0D7314|nr:helix-turn-helix domain-containing protein [Kordia sp. SMS9]AXG68654.1 DNA-binding transcriptional regulator ChbR [Kordia sp. SMS9]